MNKQSHQYIPSRLFPTGNTIKSSTEVTKSINGRIFKDINVFGKNGLELLGIPPSNSIHNIQNKKNTDNFEDLKTSTWITVYGVINKTYISKIISYFVQFGEINHIEESGNNWICIEFLNPLSAQKSTELIQPIQINQNISVYTKLGRYKVLINSNKEEETLIEELEFIKIENNNNNHLINMLEFLNTLK